MSVSANLKNYYARRAGEYEQIYQKPERPKDIAAVKKLLQRFLAERDVLEIACGTGFWTEAMAQGARSILATDINEEVLEIARNKSYPPGKVRFQQIDALSLQNIPDEFTAGFAGFWLSHLPISEVKIFLENFHAKMSPGGLVVLIDNRYAEGISTPIYSTDDDGNTYQLRKLADGTKHEIIKNFFTSDDFSLLLDGIADEVNLTELEYFWCLTYEPRKIP